MGILVRGAKAKLIGHGECQTVILFEFPWAMANVVEEDEANLAAWFSKTADFGQSEMSQNDGIRFELTDGLSKLW
eukprot:10591907-Lingulodinium_polyedra.AAC.1